MIQGGMYYGEMTAEDIERRDQINKNRELNHNSEEYRLILVAEQAERLAREARAAAAMIEDRAALAEAVCGLRGTSEFVFDVIREGVLAAAIIHPVNGYHDPAEVGG